MIQSHNINLPWWHINTAEYRENLDLATIFWLWKNSEESLNSPKTFNLAEKFNLVAKLIGMDNIQHIDPHQLWKEVGIYGNDRLNMQGTGVDCLTINLYEWTQIYQGRFGQNYHVEITPRNFSLKWFATYREKLKYATPFSDYYVINASRNPDTALIKARVIFRDTFPNEQQTTNRDGLELALINYRLELLDGMICKDKKYTEDHGIANPIVGDAKYTHSFININNLIMEADRQGETIPSVLRLNFNEKYNPTSKTQNHFFDKQKPHEEIVAHNENNKSKSYQVNLQVEFDPNEQFSLLKMAPVIIKYLRHVPAGKFLFENKSNTEIKKELCNLTKMKPAHIDHIWRVIVPPNKRKHSNADGKHLQDELISIRNDLWPLSGSDLLTMWTRTDKLQFLMDLNYIEKEAKSIIALLSPLDNKRSGKLSTNKLMKFRYQIMEIDLSWTNNTSFL